MWYTYALKSLKDNNLYIGISENPKERLKQHNSGMTKSIKHRRPFKLIYLEKCNDRKDARNREKRLKSGSGREFLKQIYNTPL